ncbi:hypothetical protein ACTFIW_005642 [Dictyostelium discoideum]
MRNKEINKKDFIDNSFSEFNLEKNKLQQQQINIQQTLNSESKIRLFQYGNKRIKLQLLRYDPGVGDSTISKVFRGTHCLIVMFDSNNKDSISNLFCWVQESRRYSKIDTPIIILGINNTDDDEQKLYEKDLIEQLDEIKRSFNNNNTEIPIFQITINDPNPNISQQLFDSILKVSIEFQNKNDPNNLINISNNNNNNNNIIKTTATTTSSNDMPTTITISQSQPVPTSKRKTNILSFLLFWRNKFFTTLVIGDTGVGKMKFIQGYSDDNYKYLLSDGSRFKLFSYDGLKIKLLLERYFDRPYGGGSNTTVYRKAQCFLLMIDVCDTDSLQSFKIWIREIVSLSKHATPIIIIGNKIDLKEHRKFTSEQALELIEQIKDNLNIKMQIPYFEISSLQPDQSQYDRIFKQVYSLSNQRFYKPLININEGKNIVVEDFSKNDSIPNDDGIKKKRKSKIFKDILSIFK